VRGELHGKEMHYIKYWERRNLDKYMDLSKFMAEPHVRFKDINIATIHG
jgi:hypothetical protein